jgi:uncharacterized protein (DUF697 family)
MTRQGGEISGNKTVTTKELRPKAQEDILLYSVFAAFTRFIPLPIVDNMVENHFERAMIMKIAQTYETDITEKEVKVLSSRSDRGLAKKLAFGSAKALLKKAVKKASVIFEAKDASDEFSLSYNVGYLIDYAFEMGFLKQYSAKALRRAVDTICHQTDSSPLKEAVSKILKDSPILFKAIKSFVEKMVKQEKPLEFSQKENSEEIPSEATDAVGKIQTEMELIPPGYFEGLRQSLANELSAKH